MTSKERLLSAFRREIPDTVPVTLYMFNQWLDDWKTLDPSYSDLVAFAREHAEGLAGWSPTPRNETAFLSSTKNASLKTRTWTEGESTFLERVVDTPKGPLRKLDREVRGIHTSWVVEHFLKTDEDIERFLSVPSVPVEWDFSSFSAIEKKIGEHGVMFIEVADPICFVAELFHFGDFTIQALFHRARMRRMLELAWERIRSLLAACLNAGVGPVYRICGPEYVTPPYLPPECFAEYVVPYDKEMVGMIRAKGFLSQLHSHGKVGRVLSLMEEIAPDAIDPFEPPPDGDITLEDVKKRIGKKIAICGNMEFRDLEISSPEEIDAKVKGILEVAKPGGAFILQPTAEPITSPLPKRLEKNMIQFVESGRKWGRY